MYIAPGKMLAHWNEPYFVYPGGTISYFEGHRTPKSIPAYRGQDSLTTSFDILDSWLLFGTQSALLPAQIYQNEAVISKLSVLLRKYFADREDVEMVFLSQTKHYFQIIVLTNHTHYERIAMMDLFDREGALRDEVGNAMLDIDYLPLLNREPGELIPTNALCVYEK